MLDVFNIPFLHYKEDGCVMETFIKSRIYSFVFIEMNCKTNGQGLLKSLCL